MSCKAVIGLGFGDEGKGATVNSLCRRAITDTLVVRYNGGQQAGHTVTTANKMQHVFSNFGSGTLCGAPTYWSQFCTVDPVGFMKEHMILQKRTMTLPEIYMHRDCPVTTPFDKMHNTTSEELLENGTCGVGVGSTFQRQEDMYSLTVHDIFFPEVMELKLSMIGKYYNLGVPHLKEFLWAAGELRKFINLTDTLPAYEDYIFEGAQGLMLDQDIGFFPHVTRSNTGSKNILTFGCVEPHHLNYYLVTRCYQTRHGNGPRTNRLFPARISHNEWETNKYNPHQGHFKQSTLDLTLIKYAMEADVGIRTSRNRTLVVTCCDQIIDKFNFTIMGKMHSGSVGNFEKHLNDYLEIDSVIFTDDPQGF